MASTQTFIEYAAKQLEGLDSVTCKKMFGEYGLHYNGKFFACICDNQFLIKITNAGRSLLPNAAEVPPYEGAKPYLLVEDLEDTAFLQKLVLATCEELPAPKPRKKKT